MDITSSFLDELGHAGHHDGHERAIPLVAGPPARRHFATPAYRQGHIPSDSEHAGDPRPHLYTLEEFEAGQTHDPTWNAAQMQLMKEGRIHNYPRMLWGSKILEWTASPQVALEVMTELKNKYALDGRDPNSCSGIFWVVRRYDRASPERPVSGKVRYMSSESPARKVGVQEYICKYAP